MHLTKALEFPQQHDYSSPPTGPKNSFKGIERDQYHGDMKEHLSKLQNSFKYIHAKLILFLEVWSVLN